MWIQRQLFFLKFQLKLSNFDNFNLTAYDKDFKKLLTNTTQNNNQLIIETWITLSNQILLEFSIAEHETIELTGMSLAMIPINKKILTNIAEYKRNASLNDFQTVSTKKTLNWDRSGCVLFNIFNPNPLAYHLYIGNQIKML